MSLHRLPSDGVDDASLVGGRAGHVAVGGLVAGDPGRISCLRLVSIDG